MSVLASLGILGTGEKVIFSTISCYVVILLTCLIGLPQAEAQTAPPSGDSAVQNPVKSVDPHSIAMLKQMNATYKKLRSFSAEYEISISGDVVFSERTRFDFRRPDQLAIATEGQLESGKATTKSNKVIMDGKHTYLMLAILPNEYTEMPYHFNAESPFDLIPGIAMARARLGVVWLESLLIGEGIESAFKYNNWELWSLSSRPGASINGMPVETITAQWVDPNAASKDWETRTYTIGIRDHMLYQATMLDSRYPTVSAVRFIHSRPNARLSDTVFALPHDATRLPLPHIIGVKEYTITLDKGSRDGVTVGDVLYAYMDEKLRIMTASLVVTETRSQDSTAEILSSLEYFPEEVCIITRHHIDSKRAKQKRGSSSLLQMSERP